VYTAADDIPIALHHSRTLLGQKGGWSTRGNRRWLGARNEGWLLLLGGHLDAAEKSFRQGMELSDEEEVSLPLQARLRVQNDLETCLLLAGQWDPTVIPGRTADADPKDKSIPRPLPVGEALTQDLRWDSRDAVAAACRGDWDAALGLLTTWD